MESVTSVYDFEQRRLHHALQLEIGAEKLRGIDTELGPEGIGTFLIRQALTSDQVEIMQAEFLDPHKVVWRDNHDSFVNQRGLTVVENHMTLALKLHKGDQSLVERVPHMRALATNIEKTIRGLSGVFPDLYGWTADEMSLHRYDHPEVGLSFHKDNLRFTGLIAVLTVEGASDFLVKDNDGNVHTYEVEEGDLMLTRATGLYPAFDETLSPINLCPDHAVTNLKTPYRTSFIVRANNRPNDLVPGFEYANWDGED